MKPRNPLKRLTLTLGALALSALAFTPAAPTAAQADTLGELHDLVVVDSSPGTVVLDLISNMSTVGDTANVWVDGLLVATTTLTPGHNYLLVPASIDGTYTVEGPTLAAKVVDGWHESGDHL